MRVLVLFGSKYGSTEEIARYIAKRLDQMGLQTEVETATYGGPIDKFDAFVIGSAVYIGSWLKEPAEWLRRHAAALEGRPVWLFSSGPLGDTEFDDQGRDKRQAAVPKEFAEFEATINPRDEHVFFGALDHTRLGLVHRMIWTLPAGRKLLTEGDFRDWDEIDAWAKGIANALLPAAVR